MTTRTSILSLSLLLSTAACGEDGPAMNAGGTTGGGGDRDDGHADDDDAGHDTAGVDEDADGDADHDGGDVDGGGDGDDDGQLVDRGDPDGGADGGGPGDGGGSGDGGGDAGDGRGDAGDDGADADDGWGDAGDGRGDAGDGGDPGEGGDSGDGWGDSGGTTCVPVEVPLLAGQTLAAGWVGVSTVSDGLRVEVQAHAPWTLSLVHVYVGIDPPPQNAGGLTPGEFPYQALLDDASEYALVVPWDVVGAACGETVDVAVHAEVVQMLDGVIVEDETAWAKGPYSKGSGWSSWLDAMLCCD